MCFSLIMGERSHQKNTVRLTLATTAPTRVQVGRHAQAYTAAGLHCFHGLRDALHIRLESKDGALDQTFFLLDAWLNINVCTQPRKFRATPPRSLVIHSVTQSKACFLLFSCFKANYRKERHRDPPFAGSPSKEL